ncbi:MAG: class I SAM-dependent methyltransferase [Candidatus Marinimicrobia bacterium]|nr:class I SAM-dependent methyltransferase [Candidatus Neomarinimicrobiota bacterium]MCF7827441.1 class I SAM-dependent methyltransferase [Candidatus Neomarinimicrobiota bacterium]MCF7882316.1 class I SAM-dependent methyltransferase [Candidatus Neomarinimicrobiota bacterium]
MTFINRLFSLIAMILLLAFTAHDTYAQTTGENTALDEKVQKFLDSHEGRWHNLNVPPEDGQLLYDLIVENGYTRALEIGTSTGHSAIWMAWALSKTGGKLITIEINDRRYKEALQNFEEAGLSEYIDARLADAHELVPALEGPFDFVFSDADKGWYLNYFKAIDPKLEVGGCFTAHNMSMRRRGVTGVQEFYQHVSNLPNYDTTIEWASRSGVSVSYKTRE